MVKVKVTEDLSYSLDNALCKKLDLMIDRVEKPHPKKDALLICEGGEGEGKTNTSVACSYYIKKESKKKRDIHLFFRLEPLIEFAKKTEGKIIIWDEPALDFLSTEWYKKVNKQLIKLLMIVRKKRHFFIFNFTKFHKFSEYVVVDRALGMIHMYSRKEIEPGRFVYIRKRALEPLFLAYRTSKKRLYRKFYSIRGSFPYVMEDMFDHMGIFVEGKPNSTYQDYENTKNKAIESLGDDDEMSKDKQELHEFKYKISTLEYPIKSLKKMAKHLQVKPGTVRKWKERYSNTENS